MRGLKRDHTARVIIRGHALVLNIRRGHYELGTDTRPSPTDRISVHRTSPDYLNAKGGRKSVPHARSESTQQCRSASGPLLPVCRLAIDLLVLRRRTDRS